MYHRISKPEPRSRVKGRHLPHLGVGHVDRQQEGNWQIDVSHRRVGSAIRRDVFSVTIRRETPAHEEFLSGFSSREAALAAARRRIDLLQYSSRRIRLRPPRKRSTP